MKTKKLPKTPTPPPEEPSAPAPPKGPPPGALLHFDLPAHICCRIEKDPTVKVVPIGERDPTRLLLWLTWPAVLDLGKALMATILAKVRERDLFLLPSVDTSFVFAIGVKCLVIRPGEEPTMTNVEGASPIVGADGMPVNMKGRPEAKL